MARYIVWEKQNGGTVKFDAERWPIILSETATHEECGVHWRCSIDVRKNADGRYLLQGISIKVEDGEVHVLKDIVGPFQYDLSGWVKGFGRWLQYDIDPMSYVAPEKAASKLIMSIEPDFII